MRRRGVRVFVFIFIVLALAIAALSFRNIDVFTLERSNDGPLGLKLGLDLQGGVMLWYEADLPDQIDVVFQDDVAYEDLLALLEAQDQPDATLSVHSFDVSDVDVLPNVLNSLEAALESLGNSRAEDPEVQTEVTFTDDNDVDVVFPVEISENDVDVVLQALGYKGAQVEAGETTLQYSITGLDHEGVGLDSLRGVLVDQLTEIDSLDEDDGVISIRFADRVLESDLTTALAAVGFDAAVVETPDQSQYSIGGLDLNLESQDVMETALAGVAPLTTFTPTINEPEEEQMDGVKDIIQRRIDAFGTTDPVVQTLGQDRVVIQIPGLGGSFINVTMLATPDQSVLQAILEDLDRTADGDIVDPGAELYSYVVKTEEPLSEDDIERFRSFVNTAAPGSRFTVSNDEPTEIEIGFPAPATEGGVADVMAQLGYGSATVTQEISPLPRFTINTDDALSTEEQDELRTSLENTFSAVTAFQAGGGIEEAKSLIRSTAQLVFKERRCTGTLDEIQNARQFGLPDPCNSVEAGGGGIEGIDYVDIDIGLTGNDLVRAFPDRDPTTTLPQVRLEFDNRGRGILREVTTRIAGNPLFRLPIFLDDQQVSAPTVNAAILNGNAVIEGGFTREGARELAIQLESGRLPVPLKLIREDTVDAILGDDSLRKSLIAGLIGLGLVLAFIVAYYKMAGLVAATALIVYAVITLAVFKLIPVTLTLSGVAGLILSIGMAVDANILIFERMKEELRAGRTLASSMEVGFRRAWSAIRDGNVSTIVTCLILWWFGSRLGTPVITGLAITLMIGVIVSMFTAILVSRNLLQLLTFTPAGKRSGLFTPEGAQQAVGVAGGER